MARARMAMTSGGRAVAAEVDASSAAADEMKLCNGQGWQRMLPRPYPC